MAIKHKKTEMTCPYCLKPAPWVNNEEVYGRRYGKSYKCYYCKDCDAYIGCHSNTTRPLGTMANRELRGWRMKAHSVLDPIWKGGHMPRSKVYQMLNKKFGKEVHVGWSNIEECKAIIEFLSPILQMYEFDGGEQS